MSHCHIYVPFIFCALYYRLNSKDILLICFPFVVIDVNDPLADKLNSMDDVDRWDSSLLYVSARGEPIH